MKTPRRARSVSGVKASQLVRRADARKKIAAEYSSLEPRQLLATDFGLNFTASTYLTNSSAVNPNMVGDIGTTHAIEAIVDKIAIFDRVSGAKVLDKTQTQFFIDIGGTVNPGSTITNSQVIFDKLSLRWLIIGEGSGNGNYIHIAISNTANPNNGWLAQRFVGDSVGVRHNGNISAGVDADALLLTTRNPNAGVGFPLSVSVYTIPKVDLYNLNPTVTNMSRFENLNPAVVGDFLRAASSFEASDGRATFIGNLSGGIETSRFDVVGVGAAGATITVPQKILFNFNPFFPTHNIGSPIFAGVPGSPGGAADVARQASTQVPPVFVNNVDVNIYADVVDINGGLWFVQTVNMDFGNDDSSAIMFYEVTKNTYVSAGPTPAFGGPPNGPLVTLPPNTRRQANVLTMPVGDSRGPDPWQWDFINPSIDVNKYGIVNINFTASSEEYEVDPTAASLTGVTVNGLSRYNPVFDTIFWVEKNTQFDIPVFIQNGLAPYENNGFNNSSWSFRSATGFDPLDVNNFWANTQWSNTANRWSTQFTDLSPNMLTVTITANDLNNVITVRRNAANNSLLELEMDGRVTDLLPYDVVGTIVLNGYLGADTYIFDYTNGDPIPENGLVIDGMGQPDVIQTNDPNGARFVVDENSGGTYNEKTIFRNMEELHGGPAGDSFLLTDRLDPTGRFIVSSGFLAGSLRGNGGDDLFHFGSLNGTVQMSTGAAVIGDSVLGGTGFNTLSFETREADTFLQLLGYGGNSGYEGRSIDALGVRSGPIGGDQPNDRFFDINYVMGSLTRFDEIRQAGVGFFNEQANVLVDDEDSIFETNGVELGFFEVNAVGGSTFVDTFVGIRNSVNPLQLNGLGADDVYYFSSDGMGLMGTTADLQGLLFAQGGSGNNVMFVSNRGAASGVSDGLILNNRISGIGEIAYNAIGGTFALNVWVTEHADLLDLHSFFQTNTLNLHFLNGDDRVSIQDLSKAVINVYGGMGNDVYAIEKIQNIDLRNLSLIDLDTVDSKRDRVTLVGTLLDETFDISNTTFVDLNVVYVNIDLYGVEAREGNDIINILSTNFELFIDGEAGDDIINIASDAPLNQGDIVNVLKDVTVEGGTGLNRLNVSARSSLALKNVTIESDRIIGMLPSTLYYKSTGGSFSLSAGTGGIYLVGADNFPDKFTINGLDAVHTLKIDALGGDDLFTVNSGALGNMLFNGGNGSDRYQVTFSGAGTRQIAINDNGSSGVDRLFLLGTPGNDIFSSTTTTATLGGESVQIQSPFVFVSIKGEGGDDEIVATGGMAPNFHLFGGNGGDLIQVINTTGVTGLVLNGDVGNDVLQVNAGLLTTYTQAYGGDGDDKIILFGPVLGNGVLDGQNGSDNVTLTVATSGSRFLNIVDSGTTGEDTAWIYGTGVADLFDVVSSFVGYASQRVVFSNKTERLTLTMLNGNDVVNINGSVAGITRINAGDGNDFINVISTAGSPKMTLDGQNGNDTVTIRTTAPTSQVTVLGGAGDDQFNIGSNGSEDNGDLNNIQSQVSIRGGGNTLGNMDRLVVNDHGSSPAYSYYVSPSSIRTIPGPLGILRPLFAGIVYEPDVEYLRLDGTPLKNFFSIDASPNTTYYIDGNSPNPAVINGDQIFLRTTPGDGHVLHVISPSQGTGYWDFTNGNKVVRYENIEIPYATPDPGSPSPMGMIWRGSGNDGGSGGNGGGGRSMMRLMTGSGGGSGSTRSDFGSLFGSIDPGDGDDLDEALDALFAGSDTARSAADAAFASDIDGVV